MNPNRRATAVRSSVGRMFLASILMLAGIAAVHPVHAQGQPVDPPGRAARLSDAQGQIWLYSNETNEWVAIQRNRPLTSGDRIATDVGARAEISLGTTTLRLDSSTELDIVRLDDRSFHVHLENGSLAARIRTPQSLAEFDLETDEGHFRLTTVGRYRFDRVDRVSGLTVYNGQGVFEGRNSALPLTTGQRAQFWLDAGGAAQYNMVQPERDGFANWDAERDRDFDRAVASTRFVSPEMTGAADLDNFGSWEQTPDYGPVWTPRTVAIGWAPYSAGHWAFVRPWGWTWVDEAPWGFAPFHYGRWVNYRNNWCWAPGTYVARPVYAPALVAWVGGPTIGVSVSIGGGGQPVGWFPLAPREVYVPSYRTSPAYVRDVNITQVTNITIINNTINNTNGYADRRQFQNRGLPNAVTVVPASVMTGRQQVGPPAAQWRNNPQVRAIVADSRPGPAMNAPPVATPPPPQQRPPDGRTQPRPPFDSRDPGSRPGGGPRPSEPVTGIAPPPGARPGAGMPPAVGVSNSGVSNSGVSNSGVSNNGGPNSGFPDHGGLNGRGSNGQAPSVQPPTAQPPMVAPPIGMPPNAGPNGGTARGAPPNGAPSGRDMQNRDIPNRAATPGMAPRPTEPSTTPPNAEAPRTEPQRLPPRNMPNGAAPEQPPRRVAAPPPPGADVSREPAGDRRGTQLSPVPRPQTSEAPRPAPAPAPAPSPAPRPEGVTNRPAPEPRAVEAPKPAAAERPPVARVAASNRPANRPDSPNREAEPKPDPRPEPKRNAPDDKPR